MSTFQHKHPMPTRIITATVSALSLAGLLALPALAQTTTASPSPGPSPAEAPHGGHARCQDGFDAGDAAGVRVCHGREGEWRLITTDPAKSGPHEYTGILTTNGAFSGVHLIRPENDDSASVDGEGNLNYDFKAYSGIDGVAFRVDDGAKEITFNLSVDGQQMAPAQIFLGDNGRHPRNDPFKLRAHPRKHTHNA